MITTTQTRSGHFPPAGRQGLTCVDDVQTFIHELYTMQNGDIGKFFRRTLKIGENDLESCILNNGNGQELVDLVLLEATEGSPNDKHPYCTAELLNFAHTKQPNVNIKWSKVIQLISREVDSKRCNTQKNDLNGLTNLIKALIQYNIEEDCIEEDCFNDINNILDKIKNSKAVHNNIVKIFLEEFKKLLSIKKDQDLNPLKKRLLDRLDHEIKAEKKRLLARLDHEIKAETLPNFSTEIRVLEQQPPVILCAIPVLGYFGYNMHPPVPACYMQESAEQPETADSMQPTNIRHQTKNQIKKARENGIIAERFVREYIKQKYQDASNIIILSPSNQSNTDFDVVFINEDGIAEIVEVKYLGHLYNTHNASDKKLLESHQQTKQTEILNRIQENYPHIKQKINQRFTTILNQGSAFKMTRLLLCENDDIRRNWKGKFRRTGLTIENVQNPHDSIIPSMGNSIDTVSKGPVDGFTEVVTVFSTYSQEAMKEELDKIDSRARTIKQCEAVSDFYHLLQTNMEEIVDSEEGSNLNDKRRQIFNRLQTCFINGYIETKSPDEINIELYKGLIHELCEVLKELQTVSKQNPNFVSLFEDLKREFISLSLVKIPQQLIRDRHALHPDFENLIEEFTPQPKSSHELSDESKKQPLATRTNSAESQESQEGTKLEFLTWLNETLMYHRLTHGFVSNDSYNFNLSKYKKKVSVNVFRLLEGISCNITRLMNNFDAIKNGGNLEREKSSLIKQLKYYQEINDKELETTERIRQESLELAPDPMPKNENALPKNKNRANETQKAMKKGDVDFLRPVAAERASELLDKQGQTKTLAVPTPQSPAEPAPKLEELLGLSAKDNRKEVARNHVQLGRFLWWSLGGIALVSAAYSIFENAVSLHKAKQEELDLPPVICPETGLTPSGGATNLEITSKFQNGYLSNIEPQGPKLLKILRENKADKVLDKKLLNSISNSKSVNIPNLLLERTGRYMLKKKKRHTCFFEIVDQHPDIIPLIFSSLNELAIMKILTYEELPNTTFLEVVILRNNKAAIPYLLANLSEDKKIALMDLRKTPGIWTSGHLAFAATRNPSAIKYLVRSLSDENRVPLLLSDYLICLAAKNNDVAKGILDGLPSQYKQTCIKKLETMKKQKKLC